MLSDGLGRRSSLDDRPLLRAAKTAGRALVKAAAGFADVGSGLAGVNGNLA